MMLEVGTYRKYVEEEQSHNLLNKCINSINREFNSRISILFKGGATIKDQSLT